MKTKMKNIIYLVIMIVMSVGSCFASDNPHQPGDYGQLPLPPGVARLPIAYQSTLLQQTQTKQQQEEQAKKEQQKKDEEFAKQLAERELLKDRLKKELQNQNLQKEINETLASKSAEAKSLKERTEKLDTQSLQQSKLQRYNNASGITEDKMAYYCNSTYLCHSFFKSIAQPFSRITRNSSLFIIRCGNRYNNIYQENNTNSSLLDLSLFNTYEKGMKIDNENSSRLGLSIGDAHISENIGHGNDTNSTNFCISISRKSLTLLGITAIAYKSGLLSTLLSGGTIIPKIVLGNTFLIFGAGVLIPTTVVVTLTIFFARNFKIR
jgi:hypothetical protein